MPMMNSEARKRSMNRAAAAADRTTDPLAVVKLLVDLWEERASREEARGNGYAAGILHNHAEQLRAALNGTATTA